MENNRNSGRENLKSLFSFRLNKLLRWIFLFFLLAAGVSFLGSVLVPAWPFQSPAAASLDSLLKQERSIKSQFEKLIHSLKQRGEALASSLPSELPAIHQVLFSFSLNSEIEGIAYLKEDKMVLWRGQVLPPSLLPPADRTTHVIRHKASFYLVVLFPVREEEKIALFQLLSFQPPLTTPLLGPYSFLRRQDLANALLEFYSEEEDTSGFEKIFSRHRDEYVSQPRARTDILTVFFPLRNESQKIVATVILRSVNPAFRVSQQKERWTMAGWLNLLLACSLVAATGIMAWKKSEYHSLLAFFIYSSGLLLIRFILLNLKALFDFKAPLFSPGLASLPFPAGLLASPIDIFLTMSLISALLLPFGLKWPHLLKSISPGHSSLRKKALAAGLIVISFFPFYLFFKITTAFILNSNLHLIQFSPFWPSLFLLLAISFLFLTLILINWSFLRLALLFSSRNFILSFVSLPAVILFVFLHFFQPKLSVTQSLALTITATTIYFLLLKIAQRPKPAFKLAVLALAAAFFYLTLFSGTSIKEKRLTETYLRHSILSLEKWAEYLLQESLPVLDQEEDLILSCLRQGQPPDLASFLWRKTPLARWNWYSSLEISRTDGQIVSRYSLNLPFLFRTLLSFEPADDWSLLKASLPLPGRLADFLIAYRDFRDKQDKIGRLTLYVLLNEEMLPFLYSAIPYFDLLRFPSVPSLKDFDFSLAIFKTDGEIIFNPARLTTGISGEILKRLKDKPGASLWSSLSDQGRRFRAYYFRNDQKIVAILWPSPGFISAAVGYLKFLFFWVSLIYLPLFLSDLVTGRRRLASLFWAFSSRIYASFVAVILIMLIPFILLLNNFFSRLASEGFSEKAEIQARVARNIIEDFLFFQEEEESPLLTVQELVHWVSTAINNDVSVYQHGALIASSRQEFFDLGILPDYLEGEIAYRLLHEKQPYVVWRKRLGHYSFQTLTIPLNINNTNFFITLSFPFERQEIGRTQKQLLEFLAFISVLSFFLVFLFARSIGSLVINPIRKLLLATKEVSSGNLEVSIDHHGHDEMQTLIEGFNRMVKSLKQHEKELAEMSRKAAWAEMARKVAHEIKNPLTPIRLSAEHLLHVYEERPEELGHALKESVAYIITEVENLRQLAQDFLALSRESPLHKTCFELDRLLLETALPYKRILMNRINFEFDLTPALTISGDREKLKIAFRNLIVNAIEAIKGRGTIIIKAKKEEPLVRVEIIDDGEGMDEATLIHIFEPDFSTKDLGTGLGLPISRKIIEDHGGKIEISSRVGQGTQVKVSLPLSPQL